MGRLLKPIISGLVAGIVCVITSNAGPLTWLRLLVCCDADTEIKALGQWFDITVITNFVSKQAGHKTACIY